MNRGFLYIVCGFVIVGLAVLGVLEYSDRQKLAGSQKAGPCRAAVADMGLIKGIREEECSRQSDFVVWSYCVRHGIKPCPALPDGLRAERDAQRRQDAARAAAEAAGGDGEQTGTTPSEQPDPPQGGSGNGDGPEGPGGSPPPPPGGDPPPPPPPPDEPPLITVDPDSDCVVNALGIRVCTP